MARGIKSDLLSEETIVFFGTGPVAAKCLTKWLPNFKIEAVITKPQPDHHKVKMPVLEVCEKNNLKVISVTNKDDLDIAIQSNKLTSKIAVLIDFGIIISEKVIDHFPLGIINSHFSILPELRGADPITFAILSGQKTTGVSLMDIVPAMDEGLIYAYKEIDLKDDITEPQLTEQLIELSDDLIKEYLPKIMSHSIQAKSQDITGRQKSYSRKLTKQDANLDFTKSAAELERQIRAFISWPGSQTKIGDIEVKILEAKALAQANKKSTPGSIIYSKDSLSFQTANSLLNIIKLQPLSKKAMDIKSFIAGYQDRIPEN